MSKIQCDSCTDLRENAPEFVAYGVTDTVAESLRNNTGLNPSLPVLHDNCEDMSDVVDCLIGRMQPDDLKSCDVPDFLGKFTGNLYETLKAMNASDCGLWEKVSKLDEMLELLKAIKDKLDECCDGGSDGCYEDVTPTRYYDACPAPFWNSHEGEDAFLDGGVATRTCPENGLIFLYSNQNGARMYRKAGTSATVLLSNGDSSLTVTFPTTTTIHMVNTNTETPWAALYIPCPGDAV